MSIGFLRLGKSLAILGILLVASPSSAVAAGKKTDLSLRIHAGASFLAAEDINAGSAGWVDYHRTFGEWDGYQMLGSFRPMHGGMDFGMDLIVHLSPRVGLGIGLSFLRSARSSTIVSQGVEALKVAVTPELMALPLRAGLHYAHPLTPKCTLTANAGVALYSWTSLLVKIRYEAQSEFRDYWSSTRFSALGGRMNNVGFQAGLGLERSLGPRVSLFTEVQLRRARFRNFSETTWSRRDNTGLVFSTTGKLYLTDDSFADSHWTYFVVHEGAPPTYSEYVEPKIDFSGVCLQAGIRIKL